LETKYYPVILSASVNKTQPTCIGTDDGIITISSPAGVPVHGNTALTVVQHDYNISNTVAELMMYRFAIPTTRRVIHLGNQILTYQLFFCIS
jgi:hypothetical protein